jgi:small subunit ribosomal protein S20
MPNSPSAEKRLRQSKIRQSANKSIKSAVKTEIKKVRAAIQSGNISSAEELFRSAAKKLDSAGARRVIHRNAAARQKSRLQLAIKKAKTK